MVGYDRFVRDGLDLLDLHSGAGWTWTCLVTRTQFSRLKSATSSASNPEIKFRLRLVLQKHALPSSLTIWLMEVRIKVLRAPSRLG